MGSATASIEDITNAISHTVRNSNDLGEVCESASDLLVQIPHVDMLMVYLVEDETNNAVLESQRNVSPEYLKSASRIPYPQGMTWKVILSNRVLNVRDAQTDPDIGPAGKALGKHGTLGLPISLGKSSRARGVMWLWSDERYQFTDDEVKMLSWVGNELADAVVWAKLFKKRRERMKKAIDTLIDLVGFSDEDRKVLKANSPKITEWVDEIVSGIFDDIKSSKTQSELLGRSGEEVQKALCEYFQAICGGDLDEGVWEREWSRGLISMMSGTTLPLTVAVISKLQLGFMKKCLAELDPGEAETLFGAFKRATDVVAGLNAEGYMDAFAEGVEIASGFSKAVIERMAKVGAEQLVARKYKSG